MWQYNYTYPPELYHHGILGQKWGVRRYQNYDGSLTQAGLKRYRESLSKYETAKKNYEAIKSDRKAGNASNAMVRNAKRQMRTYKAKANRDYKRLKIDNRADEGKRLYSEGRTISGNGSRVKFTEAATLATSMVANRLLRRCGNVRTATITSAAIAAGGTAINYAMYAKTYMDNKKLRAYYGHSRYVAPV